MVWWYTAKNHALSINSWVRGYLRSSGLDKLIYMIPVAAIWMVGALILALIVHKANLTGFAFVIMFIAWAVDSYVDKRTVTGDIAKMVTGGAVLATRAEYIGGHPQLPHGRFVYLKISGSRENPILTVVFPGNDVIAEENFAIPLLDLDKMDEKRETAESITGSILASVSEKPGKMFAGERATLTVRYQGPGGRKHLVEFSSFYHGNDEIRNWRNYLVCTQAEADTGIKPREPWTSLPSEGPLTGTVPLEEVASHANGNGTGNGHAERQSGSAFTRR